MENVTLELHKVTIKSLTPNVEADGVDNTCYPCDSNATCTGTACSASC